MEWRAVVVGIKFGIFGQTQAKGVLDQIPNNKRARFTVHEYETQQDRLPCYFNIARDQC